MTIARFNWKRPWPSSLIGKVCLGGLVVVFVSVYRWHRIVSDVPVFAPAEWVWLQGDVELLVLPDSEDLLIRRTRAATAQPEQPAVDDLSAPFVARRARERAELRREEKSAVGMPAGVSRNAYCYRYDPRDRTIESVSCEAWAATRGETATCGEPYMPPFVFVRTSRIPNSEYAAELHNLTWEGNRGTNWVALAPSACRCPKKRRKGARSEYLADLRDCLAEREESSGTECSDTRTAFLSADSDLQLSGGIGGLAGGRPSGSRRQHYHQLFTLGDPASGKTGSLSRAVRVPFVTNLGGGMARPGRDELIAMGWSADDRFVVYVGRTSFCVVHVEPGE